jgi:hypothetical protein
MSDIAAALPSAQTAIWPMMPAFGVARRLPRRPAQI